MKRIGIIGMLWGLLIATGFYPARGTLGVLRVAHHVSIVGATSLMPLTKRFVPEWEQKHPGVVVSIAAGGSWAGILAVTEGHADIGMADLIPPSRLAVRLVGYPAGRLAVAFIANNKDGVKEVSESQLMQLLLGRIPNWRSIGGRDEPVIVVSRPLSSGARAMIDSFLPPPGLSADAIIQLSNGAVLKTVRDTPGAIGYVEWRPGMGGVTMLGIGHHAFDTTHLATWPYFTKPTFYVHKRASDLVKNLAQALSQAPAKTDFGIYRGHVITPKGLP